MGAPCSADSIPLARFDMDAGFGPASNSKGLSEALAVAYYTDGDTFYRQCVAPQIHFDRREFRILCFERYAVAAPAQALDRHLVAQARDHDLPAARILGFVHGEQIAFEDAGVAHREPAHAQKIIGARREEIGVDLIAGLHVLL